MLVECIDSARQGMVWGKAWPIADFFATPEPPGREEDSTMTMTHSTGNPEILTFAFTFLRQVIFQSNFHPVKMLFT